MATGTQSSWKFCARAVIKAVLDNLPADASDKDKRRAVEAAYPFGPRMYQPYKMWRAAVREVLGPAREPQAKPLLDMPALLDTGDETLNGLLAGYRDNPADGFRRLVIADRLDELGQEGRARLVRAIKPKVADVARRLWPGSYLSHVTYTWPRETREEVRSVYGGFIMPVRDLCDMMERRTLLVDPQIAEATEIERALAVLRLFMEKE